MQSNCTSISSSSRDLCDIENAPLYSTALEEWLLMRQGLRISDLTDTVAADTAREAYVIDLTRIKPQKRNKSEGIMADKRRGGNRPIGEKDLELRFNGVNGVLPNMDMVSGSLVLLAGTLAPRTDGGSISYHTGASQAVTSWWYSWWHSVVLILASRGILPSQYRDNMDGLLRHGALLAESTGDGLHAQFLSKNIDSISLVVRPTITDRVHDVLLDAMSKLARVSSNLHEDLHHSHFFYLLMDNTHFIGLSEYVGPMGLALCSLFALFLRLAKAPLSRASDPLLTALRCVLTDLAPLVALITAMVVMEDQPEETWKYALYALATLVMVRGLFMNELSSVEFEGYAAIMVLLLLNLCFFVAGHHFALAFPLTMVVIPLSWVIFRPLIATDRRIIISYRILALVVGPLGLIYSGGSSMDQWIQSWRAVGSENLPLYLIVSTMFASGTMRYCASEINKGKLHID